LPGKNKKQVMYSKSCLSSTIEATHAFDFAKKNCYDTLWSFRKFPEK